MKYPISLEAAVGPMVDGETKVSEKVEFREMGTRHQPRMEAWAELTIERALYVGIVVDVGDIHVSVAANAIGDVHVTLRTPFGPQLLHARQREEVNRVHDSTQQLFDRLNRSPQTTDEEAASG